MPFMTITMTMMMITIMVAMAVRFDPLLIGLQLKSKTCQTTIQMNKSWKDYLTRVGLLRRRRTEEGQK